MKKVNKGEFEYLAYMKKKQVIITIILFLVSISLYVAGYIATKTNANLLTIVAVLGLLPASKSFVEMIMYLRAHGCSETLIWYLQPLNMEYLRFQVSL